MSKHSQLVYNKPTLKTVAIAAVIAMATFGVVSTSSQTAGAGSIETRNINASGIKFVGTQDLMRSVVVGDTFTYEDVTGVGSTHVDRIKAKVTIMALEGSKGDIKEYVINWGDFSAGAYMSPISETENRMVPVVGIQYRYELQTYEQVEADDAALEADPSYVRTPNWSAPVSVAPTAVTSSPIRMPLGTQYISFQYRIQISDSTWRSGDYKKDELGNYVLTDFFGTPDPISGFVFVYEEITEDNDRTWADVYDYYGPTEAEDSELDPINKVDWYYVDGLEIGDELQDIPVDPEEVNPDDFLYMQVSKQIGFDIAEVTFKIEFFDANDNPILLDGLFVNAYDVDQEQTVEFQNVSTYEVTSDTILRAEEVVTGDSTRLIFYSEDESATTSSSEFHSYRQARVKIYFEPTEVITIKSTYHRSGSQRFDFGAGFPWVEEEEEEEVVPPTREREPKPVVVAPVGPDRAKLIVGGFDHNSRKLTAKMQARIDKWLAKHSHLSTLTCTGFTSLPKRPTDVVLSENRGITACRYAKSERPELKTSVSQGIEDPRPGSDVRRVRLVLTK